jgi:hypothetical protein
MAKVVRIRRTAADRKRISHLSVLANCNPSLRAFTPLRGTDEELNLAAFNGT